jgi:hypothetical protein
MSHANDPVSITPHAVDRASERCISLWRRTREPGEGLYGWLLRLSTEALKRGTERRGGRQIAYAGLLFGFDRSGARPVLTTIMRDEHARKKREHFIDDDGLAAVMGGETT